MNCAPIAASPAGRSLRSSLSLVAVCLLAVDTVPAADRVTVQRAGATGAMTLTGEIEDYTARRLTIRLPDSDVRQSYAPDEIVRIETRQSEAHRRGLEELAAANHAAAEPLLVAALDSDARPWVQQDLLADLVRCAVCRGDRRAAGQYFVRMILHEPSSRHWEVTPLVWATEETGKELRVTAAEWLAAPAEGVRLLGASILLLDESHVDASRRALDELTRTPESHLQALAQAQLWRLRLAEGKISESDMQFWRRQVDLMPQSIRGGPMYVLGKAAAARSDLVQAAADWLWLPLVYNEDEPLAARASVDAADALARLGQSREAAALYEEVIDRYGWSPSADDAKQNLGQLASEGTSDGG